MTVYVDELRPYGTNWWCHMMTDGEIEELHSFAKRIGLKRAWFQDNKAHPHYDLVPSMRAAAIRAGAESTTTIRMIGLCVRKEAK